MKEAKPALKKRRFKEDHLHLSSDSQPANASQIASQNKPVKPTNPPRRKSIRSSLILNKTTVTLWIIISTTAVLEQEFRTGIKEMKSEKIADANEIYDFIIPLDLSYYENAVDQVTMLIIDYENARRRFHKKNLDISDDLRRDLTVIKVLLEDLKRLTNLIPEFGDKLREKRQILAIGASLASFLLGNALSLNGDSDKLIDLEDKVNLFSENNLEFEKEQIGINNELSRQILKVNKNIKEMDNDDKKYKVLVDRKNGIKSLMTILKDSINRVNELIKGALNGQVGTIIEFPEKIEKAIETVEKNSRSEAYLKNLGMYSKISKVELFKEGSTLVIRDRLTIPLADRIKEIKSYKPFWVTSTNENKLVKPILERENVIISNNLTVEISNTDLDKCTDVEDIKVCNNIPTVYHTPGQSDCVSKIALKKPIKEILETCNWISDNKSKARATRLDDNTFIIATKEDSSILMDCEDREGITYLQMHKGNNILQAKSNCLVRDEGISPDFSFRTPANEKDIEFKIINSKATYIDPNRENFKTEINEEKDKLKDLEKLQNTIDKLEAMNTDNSTVDLHKAIKALNISYHNNVKDNSQNLHHKSIWSYTITGGLALIAGILLILGLVTRMVHRNQKKDIKELVENGVGKVTVNSKSSRFSDNFNNLEDSSKRLVLLAMQIEKDDKEHTLLRKMNEVINERGVALKEEDLPEVIIEYFDEKELKRTLKGVNKRST